MVLKILLKCKMISQETNISAAMSGIRDMSLEKIILCPFCPKKLRKKILRFLHLIIQWDTMIVCYLKKRALSQRYLFVGFSSSSLSLSSIVAITWNLFILSYIINPAMLVLILSLQNVQCNLIYGKWVEDENSPQQIRKKYII